MKFYAGIGSRETPEDVLKLMTRISRGLYKEGYTLRSGGAQGADSAFEIGTNRKDIFLAKDFLPPWTQVFVDFFHPAPDRLKEYPRKLMQRNAMQILGYDGRVPVDFVVCWTKNGKGAGGTGQACRIAQYYEIPIFDLYNEDAFQQLKEFVNVNRN